MGLLDNIELIDLNGENFQKWRNQINKCDIRCSYKNDIQKFIKMVINFAEKNYDFNLRKFYTKLESFNNPNVLERKIRFYMSKEFYQFISIVEDLQMRFLFKTLYYCELKRSEVSIMFDGKNIDNNFLLC